jgi:hypothetical protein
VTVYGVATRHNRMPSAAELANRSPLGENRTEATLLASPLIVNISRPEKTCQMRKAPSAPAVMSLSLSGEEVSDVMELSASMVTRLRPVPKSHMIALLCSTLATGRSGQTPDHAPSR